MTDDGRVKDLLADRPDLESPLAALLAADAETDTWSFDDVPVDSGAFGELVACGVVEKVGQEYSLADPDAVRRALADEPADGAAEADDETPIVGVELPEIEGDARAAGLLGGALALVVAVRSFVAPAVFRQNDVVLAGNDPYFYLYWVEQSLAAGEATAELPGGIARGEPLLVATLARLTGLFGGPDAAGAVLAVYPVVSAVLTGALLYWLTLRLTADRRIALTAVVVLAVTPSHALRTALGFADHHAFDYVWLALTAAALVALAGVTDRDDLTLPGTWVAALALGIGVGAQTLAWDNGALMILPVGAVVAARALVDVRAERSPALVNAPLLAGLALGAAVTLYGHVSLGWHSDVVAAAPVLLVAGSVAVVAVGELSYRLGRRAPEVAVAEAVVTLAGAALVWTSVPEFRAELLAGLDRIFRSDDIVEVRALFSGDALGFLLLFGFFLFLALPVLVWATRQAVDDAGWVVACSYGWYFFTLSLFQVRFAGQLGIFTALFAAVGIVRLAAAVELTSRPSPFDRAAGEFAAWTPGRPDAATVGAVLLLFALVGGLGVLQSAVTVQQVTTDGADYQTAAWMADYADEHGWEGREESYVFSRWGKNRLYNYFVNGNSRSYSYAQSNYGPFIGETDPQAAVESIDGRARFVVTEDQNAEDIPSEAMQTRLHDNWGSHDGSVEGVGQFRAVYASEDGSRKVFAPVSGALLVGSVDSNGAVEVSADIDIPNAAFTYRRQTSTTENGWYAVRVPYPGSYTAGGDDPIEVTESEVTQGNMTSERQPRAHWSFDEGHGSYVFDSVGGNHGSAQNVTWTDGVQNQSLKITDGRHAQVPNPLALQESQSFTLSVWFKTNESVNYTADREFPRIAATASSSAYGESEEYQIAMSRGRLLATLGNGSKTVRLFGGDVDDGDWHHAVLTWNGTTVRLYRDGQIVGSGEYNRELGADRPLVFGASADKRAYFVGRIDEGQYYNRSLSPAEIEQLYSTGK